MAENNTIVNIPAQSSQTDLVNYLAEIFAQASGLADDGDHNFSLGNGLIIRVKANSTNAAAIYVVLPTNGTEYLLQSINYTSNNVLVYNTSASGKSFAFGLYLNTNNVILPKVIIAQDTGGSIRVLDISSTKIQVYDKDSVANNIYADICTTVLAPLGLVTMSILPSYITKEFYEDLYIVNTTPSSLISTDASIYSDGSLYKVIAVSNASSAATVCMKV